MYEVIFIFVNRQSNHLADRENDKAYTFISYQQSRLLPVFVTHNICTAWRFDISSVVE